MKYENILWASVAWTTFIVLLPLPDWMTAVLVIIGTGIVALVAYGIGRDRRMFTKGSTVSQSTTQTLAKEIVDELSHRPELMNDLSSEGDLETSMRDALGDITTQPEPEVIIETVVETVSYEPEESVAPVKQPRKRSVRHVAIEPTTEEVSEPNE